MRPSLDRNTTEKGLVRDADAAAPSCAGRAGDIVGAVRSGRSDLATNRRLLDKGVALDAHRAVADSHR